MDLNLIIIIASIAIVQFFGILFLVRRFYKETQLDYIALNSRMEKHTGALAGINGMFSSTQKHLSHFDVTLNKQNQNLQQLTKIVEHHQKNLTAIETRVTEFEKAGDLFKCLFDELPAAIDKYNQVMNKLKEDAEADLNKAQANKDGELIKYQEQELESLAVRKKLIGELPGLISHLKEALNPVNDRLKLFSGKDKYPTGTILSYPARRARTFLAAIGEQPFSLNEIDAMPKEEPTNEVEKTANSPEQSDDSIDEAAVKKVTRKRRGKAEQAA